MTYYFTNFIATINGVAINNIIINNIIMQLIGIKKYNSVGKVGNKLVTTKLYISNTIKPPLLIL